jgi:xanthine dehydrogenase accessory factor
MKELRDILAAYETARKQGRDCALATVVRVEGSAYRRPGARMLILGDGTIVGGVSGGCLERDVILRAGAVMDSHRPVIVRYDTSLESGDGAGVSLGCGGSIDVLIESLATPAGTLLMESLDKSQNQRHSLALATLIGPREASGSGQRLIAEEDGALRGNIPSVHFPFLSQELSNVLAAKKSAIRRFVTAIGPAELFFEFIAPPLELMIFGAGPDSAPLLNLAQGLGWRSTLVDVRSAAATIGPKAVPDAVLRCSLDALRVPIPSHAAAVVMTHNYAHDRAILRTILESPPAYVGVLGPAHRTERLLDDLALQGLALCDARWLHYPVGLDLGAESPEEIALAIVAEITAVLNGRAGGPLKERPGPIHAGKRPSMSSREGLSCQTTAS